MIHVIIVRLYITRLVCWVAMKPYEKNYTWKRLHCWLLPAASLKLVLVVSLRLLLVVSLRLLPASLKLVSGPSLKLPGRRFLRREKWTKFFFVIFAFSIFSFSFSVARRF